MTMFVNEIKSFDTLENILHDKYMWVNAIIGILFIIIQYVLWINHNYYLNKTLENSDFKKNRKLRNIFLILIQICSLLYILYNIMLIIFSNYLTDLGKLTVLIIGFLFFCLLLKISEKIQKKSMEVPVYIEAFKIMGLLSMIFFWLFLLFFLNSYVNQTWREYFIFITLSLMIVIYILLNKIQIENNLKKNK